ncbi:tRNA sulfurtransferase [Haloplanus natans]|uniref:tRNA sulfurtransferase n=1 Tax=Haloplanus natans TaxID=376171 RepID=UPI000677D831|nr:THUMP domain-containing protein [Haloplanus natans]
MDDASAPPATPDTVLVSFGDLSIKSREVRGKMTRRLRDNVAALLDARGVDAAVEAEWARIVVHTAAADRAARVAADAMGVVWARPAVSRPADLDAVTRTLATLAGDAPTTGTYAVRARRAGDADDHDFSSRDIERVGGRAVGDVVDATVDLDAPDRTYHVEVRGDDAYVAATTHAGPGGLPLGTQDPLVALVSGGHDSPVAAYEAMRRGSPIRPVYVSPGDYGGPDHEARAVATVRRLARYAPNFDCRLRVVPGGPLAETLHHEVGDTRMLSWRRALLTAAETVADREGAVGIVTGEALGQKSSQTAANLAVTDAAVDLPVHRPLLTWDKAAIVDRARAIGTDDDSSIPVGCERLAPSFPETRATLDGVEAAEPDDLLDRAAAAADDLRVVDPPAQPL